MIKVICEIKTLVDFKERNITMRNCPNDTKCVELEIDGERYVISGNDLITAINNCLNDNKWC